MLAVQISPVVWILRILGCTIPAATYAAYTYAWPFWAVQYLWRPLHLCCTIPMPGQGFWAVQFSPNLYYRMQGFWAVQYLRRPLHLYLPLGSTLPTPAILCYTFLLPILCYTFLLPVVWAFWAVQVVWAFWAVPMPATPCRRCYTV